MVVEDILGNLVNNKTKKRKVILMSKIKEAKLSKKEKEANIIEEILSSWFDDVENNIKDPKRETVWAHGFMFIYSEGNWVYDIDYTFVNCKLNIWTALKILQEVKDVGIKNVIIGAGSESVWDKEFNYQGNINWDDSFDMLMENPELTEKQVQAILKKKVIKEYKLSNKE